MYLTPGLCVQWWDLEVNGSLFCKYGVIFANFPLFEREFLPLKVFARVWKANTKRQADGREYIRHRCCMKFILSKELHCSSQEELQEAESFWKLGFKSYSNIKKNKNKKSSIFSPIFFYLYFNFITIFMGNAFWPQ